jgi:hypothetical protein
VKKIVNNRSEEDDDQMRIRGVSHACMVKAYLVLLQKNGDWWRVLYSFICFCGVGGRGRQIEGQV